MAFLKISRRIWLYIGLALAAIVLGGLLFLQRSGVPADEVAEMALHGSERELRDTLRAPGPGARVLLIAIDGLGIGELKEVLDAGRMPYLAQLLGQRTAGRYAHGLLDTLLTILPSTTMAAWSSIYTGEPAGVTGVPGNEWFERDSVRFMAPAPVSIHDHAHTLEMLTDGLVGNAIRVPTVFERLNRRAFVSLAPVYRGADLYTTPAPEAVASLFTHVAQGVLSDGKVTREIYGQIDEEGAEEVAEAIEKHGVPDLQVAYFPGIDLYTHVAQDPLREQRLYLSEIIDPAIGDLLEAYEKAGAMDSLIVLLVSDHGHTPVLEDDRHALGADGDDEPAAVLRHAGFRVRPFRKDVPADSTDFQAVLAYQGALAYVYLADRSTCPAPGARCAWARPPRHDDVLAAARAFYRASERGEGVPALKGTLDLVIAREPVGPDGRTRRLTAFDGHRFVPIADYLRAHPRPAYIDFLPRLRALAEGPAADRAGDLLLLTRSGMNRPLADRFYFSSEYRSWHGSPCQQDSHATLLLASPGLGLAPLRRALDPLRAGGLTQLDVTPLLERLLPPRPAL